MFKAAGMSCTRFVCLIGFCAAALAQPSEQARVSGYGKLPLSFEANQGQSDRAVKFLARGQGYALFLTETEAVMSLRAPAQDKPAVVRMRLAGANRHPQITALDPQPGTSNYFTGKDPANWRRDVPNYASVKYAQVYPDIDLIYRGNQRQLEYDFIVAPGADPSRIELTFKGIKRLSLNTQGDLVLTTANGDIVQHKPVVYQEINGRRRDVGGEYVLRGKSRASFRVAKYDTTHSIVIDPVLVYSTYLGGSSGDVGYAIAVDATGNAYVTGWTYSSNFPTASPFQATRTGNYPDAFVAKLNAAGTALVYSTYLGGSYDDIGQGITVDSSGNAYVTGYTTSLDFPTMSAFQASRSQHPGCPAGDPTNVNCGNADAFVAKLNASGSLVYSSYLGGSRNDYGIGIAVDSSGDAYVVGSTDSNCLAGETPCVLFPTTANAFQRNPNMGCGISVCGLATDLFVTKLNSAGNGLVYSTYLGGTGYEVLDGLTAGIAVDSSGNAYVTGYTFSTNFPVTAGAFQTTTTDAANAFVTKLNPTGSALVYSTYLGGSDLDVGRGIAVDGSGAAYVTGFTDSLDFPTASPYQAARRGIPDAFVAKLNPAGSALVYSTYLGGSAAYGQGIAVDSGGNAYVTGWASSDFPAVKSIQPPTSSPAFVTKFNPAGSVLVYSTLFGGSFNNIPMRIAVDGKGNAYVAGYTDSFDFPTLGAIQSAFGGISNGLADAFVYKIGPEGLTTVTSSLNPSNPGQSVTFTATVVQLANLTGTVQFMDGATALGTPVALSNSTATYSTSSLAAGSHSITAVYSGDADNAASTSSVLTQTVRASNNVPTSTAMTSSLNPSTAGLPVTFTATVTGSGAVPSGTVTFVDGATTLGTGTVSGSGQATFTTSSLAGGSHSITAVYGGDTNYAGSTSSSLAEVVLLQTTTILASLLDPSTVGDSVTFAAAVTGSGAVPTGTVTFIDGATTLGTGTLTAAGQATFTTSSLARGSHSITAHYGGDATYAGSTSGALTQVVLSPTTTTLTSSLNPSTSGQPVTFTATVTGAGGVPAPTGFVQFKDSATPLGSETQLSGSVATLTSSALIAGSHSITATYRGDPSNGPSTSTPLTQTVNASFTVTSISPASGPVAGGTMVTISGTGFLAGPQVTFGGTPATNVTLVNSTTITATTPAHTAGAVDVKVINSDGKSGVLALAFTFTPPGGQSLTITTFAGPPEVPGAIDGTGGAARFNSPKGIALDSSGNIYVADSDNHTIRKITMAGGVTTLAGLAATSGAVDGKGSAARFSNPTGVALDGSGNAYVADSNNYTIRKITSAGVVTTLAGLAGQSGSVDGTGSAARFGSLSGVATDSSGNVYATDGTKIRKITPAGVVTTLADLSGSVPPPGLPSLSGVAVDSGGNIYVTDYFDHILSKVAPGGAVTTLAGTSGIPGISDGTGSAARFYNPSGVATDSAGNVYVADTINNMIRKVSPAGVVVTIAGVPVAGSTDGSGKAARFFAPGGVTVDTSGNVYVSDTRNHAIRRITAAGDTTTIAGLGGIPASVDATGSAARFHYPRSVATDTSGNIYVADSWNQSIRKITPSGVVTTLAGLAETVGSANGIGTAARFNMPNGVATDTSGNVYVADENNSTIRKITPAGVVTTLAGLAAVPGSVDASGDAARFNYPTGLATDCSGNVYVADQSNHTIRKITPAGAVTTLAGSAGVFGSADGVGTAARFNYPTGVAADANGTVYVADWSNHTIRKITSAGAVTTLAGLAGNTGSTDGTGTAARFTYPYGVVVDGSGNVYVADGTMTIRKITAAGEVTTLAGLAGTGGAADGTGNAARFSTPSGLAFDSTTCGSTGGNLYIADTYNNIIRVGKATIGDVAAIDASSGNAGVIRQLDTAPQTATSWQWSVIRRPSGSTAEFSWNSVRNPTFTPDVSDDLFEFRLLASTSSGSSMTTVSFAAQSALPKGDGNGDGQVTVADVFYIINYLFANGASPIGSIDVNGDGKSTVADIFYLINYLFANGPAPLALASPTSALSQPMIDRHTPPTIAIGPAAGVAGGMLRLPVVLRGATDIDGLSFQIHYTPDAIRSIAVRRAGAFTAVSPVLEAMPRTENSISYLVSFSGSRLRIGPEAIVAEIDVQLSDEIRSNEPVPLTIDRDKTALSTPGGLLLADTKALAVADGSIEVVQGGSRREQ